MSELAERTETDEWRARELRRGLDQIYSALLEGAEMQNWLSCVVRLAGWPELPRDHFAHPSVRDPSLIAFTETEEKGKRDIQTILKPGRYLAKFCGVTDQAELTRLVDVYRQRFGGNAELKWAKTPAEFARVYSMRATFGSCMQASLSNFNSDLPCELPHHPCYVYGAGDLELAYLTDESGESLHARAIVWRGAPDGVKVSRVYGDGAALRRGLQAEGIQTASNQDNYDSLAGARILRINIDDGDYLLPYIDSCGVVSIDGDSKHWQLCSGYGRYSAGRTDGCANEPEGNHENQDFCEHCEEYYEEGTTRPVHTHGNQEQYWCESCRSEHAFYCEQTDANYHDRFYTSALAVHRWSSPNNYREYEICIDEVETFESEHSNLNFLCDQFEPVTVIDMDGNQETWADCEADYAGEQGELVKDDDGAWHVANTDDDSQPELPVVAADFAKSEPINPEPMPKLENDIIASLIVACAEQDLSCRLTDGQRRDLLRDNTNWEGDMIDVIVGILRNYWERGVAA